MSTITRPSLVVLLASSLTLCACAVGAPADDARPLAAQEGGLTAVESTACFGAAYVESAIAIEVTGQAFLGGTLLVEGMSRFPCPKYVWYDHTTATQSLLKSVATTGAKYGDEEYQELSDQILYNLAHPKAADITIQLSQDAKGNALVSIRGPKGTLPTLKIGKLAFQSDPDGWTTYILDCVAKVH